MVRGLLNYSLGNLNEELIDFDQCLNESTKPNKNNLGKINLKNLLAWSLERAVNTVGDTIITKNNIAPSKIEFKYKIASNSIF